ncbi:hypothetical protein QUB47_16060 [Microcoleus sp. AT9_B5]
MRSTVRIEEELDATAYAYGNFMQPRYQAIKRAGFGDCQLLADIFREPAPTVLGVIDRT